MESKLMKRIFAMAGALDRRTRRHLAPNEARDGRRYDHAFETLKAAVKDDRRATRALLELDESATGLTVSEADIAIQLTLIEGSRRDRFVCGGRIIKFVPISQIPSRCHRISR